MVSGPSWARRYGMDYQGVCARRGCDAPAVATLRFQPTHRAAWLIDIDAAAAHSERNLCTRHATALVLPTGWRLFDDRRTSRDAAEVETPAVGSPAPRARRVDLASVPAPAEHPEPAAVSEAHEASGEEPEAEPEAEPEQPHVAGEALIDVLDARTPLLQRAFRNVWPGADS